MTAAADHRQMPIRRATGLLPGLLCLFLCLSAACDRTDTETATAPDAPDGLSRDEYGTPRIVADNVSDLFHGYGYAVGQDRLFQMEMLKRTVQGRVAEVLGEDFAALDLMIRTGFDPDDIQAQLNALPSADKEILEGYAAGLNAWIAAVNDDPQRLLPAEFIHYGFQPQSWSAYDVVMVFVGSMAHRYADFNEEIANLEFLHDLTRRHGPEQAWQMFDATMPLYATADPVTVPTDQSQRRRGPEHHRPPPYIAQMTVPGSPPRPVVSDNRGRYRNPAAYRHTDPMRRSVARAGTSSITDYNAASNLWMLSGDKLQGADSTLFNGPQFGWSLPSYVYGIELQGAGYAVRGNTLLAYPAHLFGHNQHIGWGSTAGMSDLVDIYFHRLNPDNPEQYHYKGRYVDFEKRRIRFAIKGQADKTAWVYRSHYGPVISRDVEKSIAYSKKRSWEGHEVENLVAWIRLGQARNFSDFRAQIKRISVNINFYYMDRAGNIGYIHAGKYPRRHPEHDPRLPVPGDGRYDWQGYLDFDDNPQTYNPPRGYLYNWNNRPERNWPGSDLWWANWSPGHRATILDQALSARRRFTPEQVWQLNRMASHRDINADFFIPELMKTSADATREGLDAIALLADWDKLWLDADADGYFDHPANLIMEHWLRLLLKTVYSDDIGPDFMFRFAATGYPTHAPKASISMQPGCKILVRHLLGAEPLAYDFFNGRQPLQVLLETFEQTIVSLRQEHGTDMQHWRIAAAPLEFLPYNFRGVPQALPDAAPQLPVVMNRGSENNQFTAVNGRINAIDVIPPAQSGFIAPGSGPDDYPLDQMELYLNYQAKPVGTAPAEAR